MLLCSFVAVAHENAIKSLMNGGYILSFLFGDVLTMSIKYIAGDFAMQLYKPLIGQNPRSIFVHTLAVLRY